VLSAVLSASWLGQALADRVFMLSWETRCVLLALNTVSAAWILHRFAISPWRNRLDRHGAALLVERSVPEFKSSLISSVELAAAVEKPSPSRPLIERLLAETSSHKRIHQLPSRVVRTAKLRGTALRTLPVIAIVLLFYLGHRPFSDLLASRVF